MSGIKNFLESDHARCDAFFEQSQVCVEKGDWTQASIAFQQFERTLTHHLAMEEQVLFPVFEQAIGQASGPTSVMRSEHVQLRRIVDRLNAALAKCDADAFFASAETLQIMM